MRDVLFIQFAREPLPGEVKTRMLPALSAQQACALHCELVLWTAQTLTRAGLGSVELHIAGNIDSPLFQQCQELGVSGVLRQNGEDLGERMYRALHDGLRRFDKVILVGSDSPQMNRAYLAQAVAALDVADAVLGPAQDGGYVLVGATRVDRAWFAGVEWGSDTVFAETVARLEGSGTRWQSLKVLQDIDRPEDLPVWRAIADSSV